MTIAWSFDGVALDATNGIRLQSFDHKTGRKSKGSTSLVGRGARLLDQTLGPLEIRLAGEVYGSSTANYFTSLGVLTEALSRDGLREFIVDDGRSILAYVSKDLDVKTVKNSAITEGRFKVTLTAPDPVWESYYGAHEATAISSGTTTDSITNDGDAPAHWRGCLTTAANFSNKTLELYNDTSGKVLRLAGFGLTTSEMLVIDTRLGRVAQESGAYPDDSFGIEVVDGDFFLLEPGDNYVRAESDQAMTLDWYYKDSYWGPA